MSRSGRLALACLTLAILGAALPGAASAEFTSSNVTAPADPFTGVVDLRGGATSDITVSGTVTGQSPGDMGRIICDRGGSTFAPITSTIDVSSGSFSTTVPAKEIAGKNCVVRMVNADFTAADDRAPFTGPSAYGGTFTDQKYSGAPNNGVLIDGTVTIAPGTIGSNIYVFSMGSCGIGIAPPLGTGPFYADYPFSCAGYYYQSNGGVSPTATEVAVDGHNAYLPGMAGSDTTHAFGAPGLAPVDFHPAYDPATGVITVDETGIVQRCSGTDAYNPPAATCASNIDTGVKVTRHWVTGTNGTSATLTDTWSVTDGGTHQIALLPEVDGGTPRASFDFPWLGNGYVQYKGDPSLPGPGGSGPVTFFTESDDPSNPTVSFGSLTVNPPPDDIEFWGEGAGIVNRYPQIAYSRTITPSQPFSYTWNFATGRTDASVRDPFAAPVVKITAPANGLKTVLSDVTVTGTATDNVAVTSFTVNGKPVPIGSGGDFSTTVPLNVGANTIVVQAADQPGNVSTASVAVTRIRQCVVPHLKGKTLSRARRALRKAHCKLGKVKKAYRTHLAGKRGHRRHVPFKKGRIVAQHPRAGAKKTLGTKVNVVVQRAKPKPKPKR